MQVEVLPQNIERNRLFYSSAQPLVRPRPSPSSDFSFHHQSAKRRKNSFHNSHVFGMSSSSAGTREDDLVSTKPEQQSPTTTAAAATAPTTCHFSLACEPNPLQRKSYRNERRYLLPNPLIVRFNGSPDAVVVGSVEVFLVNDAGALFSKDMQDMLEGAKLKTFDDQNQAAFSLLMRTISGDMNLRLKFVVRYRFKTAPSTDAERQEEFLSHPFRVESNRKKPIADHPRLLSIEPSRGPRNSSEKVILRGANFGDGKNIRVRFGGHPVAVVNVEKDTIIAVAPQRPDITPDSQVPVQIGYSHQTRGVVWRPEALFYTYLGDKEGGSQQPASTTTPVIKQSPTPSLLSSSASSLDDGIAAIPAAPIATTATTASLPAILMPFITSTGSFSETPCNTCSPSPRTGSSPLNDLISLVLKEASKQESSTESETVTTTTTTTTAIKTEPLTSKPQEQP